MKTKSVLILTALGLVMLSGCARSTPETNLDDIVAATLTAMVATDAALPDTAVPTATEPVTEEPTPEPPTETPITPTPRTDAEAIKVAVNAYLDNPIDESTITVSEIFGKLARGGIPGAYFLAAKEDGNWIIIYAGQATPYCNLINPYAFPYDWVQECFDEDGTLVQRSEEDSSTVTDALGVPTWTDAMDSRGRWYLVSTDNVTFKMEGGALVMTVKEAGGYDEWGVAAGADITDFYLELTTKTGSQCSGLDRYGIIFRVPDPSEGYIFEVSCNGRFRLYQWDGETYTGLQNWILDDAIESGPDQENRIGVMVIDQDVTLYANDEELGKYILEDYPKGRFGLVVGSSETDNFNVRVDTVRFWDLAND